MRRAISVLMIVCCVWQSGAARHSAQKEVEATFRRFISAFNNLDWEAFRNTFADDVTVFNPDIPETPSVNRVDGRLNVEAGFKSVFAATRQNASGPPYLHITPKNLRIQMYGAAAIVTFEFDRDNNSFGRRTLVFHRESGGWKITHIHASNVTRRD